MAWRDEAALPFTPYGHVYFSPIVNNLVYILDRSKNFWNYNLATKQYTELTSPTYNSYSIPNGIGRATRSLVPSPNGTKLACVSEVTNNYRGGKRIEIYTIATDTWAASSQVQNMDDEIPVSRPTVIAGLIWADEDTIWCWAAEAGTGVKDYARCIKYTISTDTFTIYPALLNGGLTYVEVYSAAINAAGTVIYGSAIGASTLQYYTYTIATDTYALGGTLTAGRAFMYGVDSDKLWYVTLADYRYGYIDIADASENDNQFTENTDRDVGYGEQIGITDAIVDGGMRLIIVHARAAPPELMREGLLPPIVQTLAATGVT